MLAKLYTASLVGLDCKIVEVEVDFRKGQTYFSVVGLADKTIQEAKDRIPVAIRNSGYDFTPVKIIINLAPAELHKSGPSYDLPLALGYLIASEQLSFNPEKKLFIGEIALDGKLRPINGILPIADSISKMGFEELYIPEDNAEEASVVKSLKVFAFKEISSLVEHLNKTNVVMPFENKPSDVIVNEYNSKWDFKDIKGQMHAKRALEVSAAGSHNILLSGVPGSGKTLLSRCLPSILPELSLEESLEVTRIYSVRGLTSKENPLVKTRPFRTPHHSSSDVALVGGGGKIKPGEISLAHRGVLFLDEFPEFSAQSIEALRQPLEDKIITISRASGTLTFPANFMLIAAMNPCRCGFAGDPEKSCSCSAIEVSRYQKKLSGPIIDRIDLLVNVQKVKNNELFNNSDAESSKDIKKRVQMAREFQAERFKGTSLVSNSDMLQMDIKKYINLSKNTLELVKNSVLKMNLSARSYFRILKVSRTIADLEQSAIINEEHLLEALSYRIDIAN